MTEGGEAFFKAEILALFTTLNSLYQQKTVCLELLIETIPFTQQPAFVSNFCCSTVQLSSQRALGFLCPGGARVTMWVLRSSINTVPSELQKKEAAFASVNTTLLCILKLDEIAVNIEPAGGAEMGEMPAVV